MITLTCMHKVDNVDDSYCVTVKDYDRTGNRAVAYKTVCHSCYKEYENSGDLFYKDDDALSWLMGRE